MIPADPTDDERRRLAELYALGILDSAADPAFDEVTRLAQRLFDVEIALVSLVDEDRQWFKSRQGLDAPQTSRDVAFCAHTILGDGPFVVENACDDPRFHDNPLVTEDPSIRFYAGAPLHTPTGQCVGTLCIIDGAPRQPNADDLETLQDLAAVVEREIAQASTAVTDPLTGLHNRRGLLTAAGHILPAAARSGEPISMVYADLDGLKLINDGDGHHAGDEAICIAARLMRETVREADIVARMGGDEFAMLLYGADEQAAGIPVARLRRSLSDHNATPGVRQQVSMSIGLVEWVAGESVADLLARADVAMYAEKQARPTR